MSGLDYTMYTIQKLRKSNSELAQYYNKNYNLAFDLRENGFAKRLFLEEYDVNYQITATNYLEKYWPESIGCTALHLAAKQLEISDVEFLLSRGSDPMIKSRIGLTALHLIFEQNRKYKDDISIIKSTCSSLLSAQVKSENFENPRDTNGISHFHIACMADHTEAVQFFLQSGVFVDEPVNADSPYFPSYTPLHLAARYSALEVVKLLLNSGANTQLKNAQGMTFLCTLLEVRTEINQPFSSCKIASGASNLEMINFLLRNYWCPMDYKGLTHFHLACSISELSIAERLLQGITDINHAVDFDAPRWPGYTALHFAAYSSIEMVKMLMKNGANILAKDAKGVTPLDMCTEKYKLEDVHSVMSLDATCRSILMSDRKTRLLNLIFAMKDIKQFDYFLEPRARIINTYIPLDSPVWQGMTPMHLAVMFYDHHASNRGEAERKDTRSEHIIRKFMDGGANINGQDIWGRSPIHLAFRQPLGNSRKGLMKLLLEFSDEIREVIDEDNLSHLHIACRLKAKEAIEKILQSDVDVNVMFKGKSNVHDICFGSTPLHCIADRSDEKIHEFLLLRGANPLLKNANDMTAIHLSGDHSNAIMSSPNLKDSVVADTGLSHLHIASYWGNVTAAKRLLDNGANVNQEILKIDAMFWASAVRTPLDLAITSSNDSELVELLVRRGAEIISNEPVTMGFSEVTKSFIASLSYEDNLLERLETEIGLMKLHVACCKKDVDMVVNLLAAGANVNARINVKSRFASGYTPLHVITDELEQDDILEEIVSLLLVNGADVTLTAMQETALHLAYDAVERNLPRNKYSCLKMMLKNHKDYTVNPTRIDGLSHFHIACSVGDIVAVENFLKHGADVNQPTEIFMNTNDRYSLNKIGCTPIHFAVASSDYAVDATTQLQLVDLLLNYGADVDAKDVNGNTALHFIAQLNTKCEDVIFRMNKSKADMNSRNSGDQTPLEILIKTNITITTEDIKCFLKFGCLFNTFNSITGEGLLAIALTLISCEDLILLIRSLIINFPHLVQTDKMGRTVIHNIVSNKNKDNDGNYPVVIESQYVTLIEELVEFGHDVDDQDTFGKTPLHLAVEFRNEDAACALLMVGADVNITDLSGKTAFSYFFYDCSRCTERKIDYCHYDHYGIIFEFVWYMKKLLFCELDVNQTNEILMFKAYESYCNSADILLSSSSKSHLNEVGLLKIAQSKLTLENFLSETNAIVRYPILPQVEREAVDTFFKDEISNLRIKYQRAAGIIFLQYRKAVKRVKLTTSAQAALNILSGILLPDLCVMEILNHLTNSDLSSMIKATV